VSRTKSIALLLAALCGTTGAFYLFVSTFRHKGLALLLMPLLAAIAVFVLPTAAHAVRQGARTITRNLTWAQGLFILCFVSGIVWRVREQSDINSNLLDGFAILRVGIQTIIALVLIFRLIGFKNDWPRALFGGVIGVVAAYPLLSLISTVWSVKPAWTLYKSVEYLVDLSVLAAFIITLKSREDFERLINIAWSLLGLMLVSAWVGALIDPSDALKLDKMEGPLTGRLNGVIPQIDANSIGEWSAILAIVALGRTLYDPRKRFNTKWYWILVGFAVPTLIYSQTRAAIGGFVVAFVVLLFLSKRYGTMLLLAGAGVILGGILLAATNAGTVLEAYFLRGHTTQAIADVSGRLDWWEIAIAKFWQRPWTGYGGYAGGRFVVLDSIGRKDTGDILSSWVQPLIDIGIPGFLVLLTAITTLWISLMKACRQSLADPATRRLLVEALCVMTIIQIRSFFTGNLITHDAMTFLVVLGCAEFGRRFTKLRQANPLLQ
jgi:O-antigen ligase